MQPIMPHLLYLLKHNSSEGSVDDIFSDKLVGDSHVAQKIEHNLRLFLLSRQDEIAVP
jgi:hypothetical protein